MQCWSDFFWWESLPHLYIFKDIYINYSGSQWWIFSCLSICIIWTYSRSMAQQSWLHQANGRSHLLLLYLRRSQVRSYLFSSFYMLLIEDYYFRFPSWIGHTQYWHGQRNISRNIIVQTAFQSFFLFFL